ncbi:hypothetical protein J437_LFUL006173 [Ladona fulva]|uniref:Uncharacterized protein n=1 Tax=Ladona fulva TaxID=123851 RepID=A0A8K0JZY2_LADFU|nr:hypothetical protein J437_LFUL006173 [Ladona fulva]
MFMVLMTVYSFSLFLSPPSVSLSNNFHSSHATKYGENGPFDLYVTFFTRLHSTSNTRKMERLPPEGPTGVRRRDSRHPRPYQRPVEACPRAAASEEQEAPSQLHTERMLGQNRSVQNEVEAISYYPEPAKQYIGESPRSAMAKLNTALAAANVNAKLVFDLYQ